VLAPVAERTFEPERALVVPVQRVLPREADPAVCLDRSLARLHRRLSGLGLRRRDCEVGLLVAFATLLYLGPDVDHRKWRFLTPGSLVAALLWIAASGLFAVYTSMFGSYNKTWGTLSAVIVTLTWLWLTAMALLFGAEINAEAERSRRLRERS